MSQNRGLAGTLTEASAYLKINGTEELKLNFGKGRLSCGKGKNADYQYFSFFHNVYP